MEKLRCEQIKKKKECERAARRRTVKLVEKRKQMQRIQRFKNAEKVKKMSKLIENEKKLRKEYDELAAKYRVMEQKLEEVHSEKAKLITTVNALKDRVLTQQALLDDDKKVLYYTGLPSYSVLQSVFSLVVKGISDSSDSGLGIFNQYLITLMKLRLDLGEQDLAYRFGINQSTVSRYISKWVDILFTKLFFLIQWPERDQLVKTMPADFREHFRKCTLIIDCFEIFMQRPTSLKARAQTFSNYKKHNTVKFLIGITPQGSVAFISKGWGGRASDVYITENCGVLQKLLPGDIVLADRGFTVQESAGLYCAEVHIPPFTKGKAQLSKVEVDTARRLSRVRIHVERVIGLVRQKYAILQSTLPVNMVSCTDTDGYSIIDKILTICCALSNCCNSVVPFN